jgi:hypothetical protein
MLRLLIEDCVEHSQSQVFIGWGAHQEPVHTGSCTRSLFEFT